MLSYFNTIKKIYHLVKQIYVCFTGCPETPEIMMIKPNENKVTVQWRERFNGGFPQSVFIQYRRRDVQYWNEMPVSDSGMHSDYIDGLTPGTEYLIRVYSKNMKGASNFTDMKLIRTGKHHY